MSDFAIQTFDLSKKYKLKKGRYIQALNKVNISIKDGEIFGLLGPNGAGKTTLVEILTTLLQPTSGYAEVLGYNILKQPNKIKNKLGLMLGHEIIYHRLTGEDNLKFFARIYNIKDFNTKIIELATLFGIENWLDEYVEKYSRGMKLKLALCRVLLIEPEILFLDEPMLGLDPNTIKQMINILLELNHTILITSHQMHVIQQVCDRVAFLNKGNVIKVDTQENFQKLIRETVYIRVELLPEHLNKLKQELSTLNYVIEFINEKRGGIIHMNSKNNYPDLLHLLSTYPITKIQEVEPTLGDIFIELSKI
jgi:ABC-2 type transport system ATP-binding protein